MSVLTIGGLLLIVGAFLQWRGFIFRAIVCWIFADVCWIINALLSNDYMGTVTIAVGLVLGVLTTIKMHTGKFHKKLNK